MSSSARDGPIMWEQRGEAGQDEITCNPSIYQFNLSKMLPAAGSWEMLLFHMHLHIKKT